MHARDNTGKTCPDFLPYLFATVIAATMENLLFHWTDTISKRLQQNPMRVSVLSPYFSSELKQVILPNITNYSSAFSSLYQGLKTGIAYRILQRNVMFVGQPRIDYFLNQYAGPTIDEHVGVSYRKPITASLAGLFTCFIEMPFLMLDTVKVRMQTQGMGFKEAIMTGNLYNAAGITLVRNVIAATFLFGGSTVVRQSFGLNNPQEATLKQEFIASSVGAVLATSCNNWADMIKTRKQGNYSAIPCITIAKNIWAAEGIKGMFLRGLIPRLCTVAPRTAFTMTVVNQLVKKVNSLSEQGFFSRRQPVPVLQTNTHEHKPVKSNRC